MTEGFDFKRAFATLVQRTEDPLGPIKLQEAYRWADRVGKMLAHTTKLSEVITYRDALLSFWPDNDELNKICGSPAFVMAVAGIFSQALVNYARETHDGVQDESDGTT
jgi:hypothetical protein